jgi:hypothetical protein
MGPGGALDWAEAILDAGLNLWAAIPFEQQPARWPAAQRRRWAQIRAAAHRERIVGEVSPAVPANRRSAAVNTLMHKRNRAMLDAAGALLTVWEPGRLDGGTATTLAEAVRRGMPGVHLDPVNQTVTFRLPDLEDLEPYTLFHTGCRHIARVASHRIIRGLLTELRTTGCDLWQLRPARPRETFDDGCPTCLPDLAAAAQAATGIMIPA